MSLSEAWVSTGRRGRVRSAAHVSASNVAPTGMSHHSSADTLHSL